MQKGEITAFLSLIFLLILSFAGAVIESASIQVLKNNRRVESGIALESVFAEYDKKLLEEYDIFALDGSYESGEYGEEKIVRRMEYYGAGEGENQVEKSELLTDRRGMPFYAQAVRYVENKLGIDGIVNGEEEMSAWEKQEEDGRQSEREEKQVQEELQSMLGEAGETLPEENNPIQLISNIRQSNLLQFILQDDGQVSNKNVRKEELASVRELKKGKSAFESQMKRNPLDKFFFNEYVMEHFSDFTSQGNESALDYELEYLIGGRESDRENLETVLKKIIAIRFVANYAYLLTDEEKKLEAEAMAIGLSALLAAPGVTEVVKHGILLAWAYGESIMDARVLVRKEKVPTVKNSENWQLQLSELLKIENGAGLENSGGAEEGMSYQDYLKGLLLLEEKETLAMRVLDLIESNLDIRADDCVARMEVKSECGLRRGIRYDFSTYFGYQ